MEKPQVFAGNRLVIAVPEGQRITSLDDLAKPGTKIVIGAKSVPVGSYTREVLGRLPGGAARGDPRQRRAPRSPRSPPWSASSTQGAADAGFVYVTDVEGGGG